MEYTKLKPDPLLMTALDFTEDDLEANRTGRITEPQRNLLKKLRLRRVIQAFIYVGISVIAALYFVTSVEGLAVERVTIFIVVSVSAVIYTISVLLTIKNTFNLDIQERLATSLDGFLKFYVIAGDESGDTYQIKLDDKVWKVDSLAYDTLKVDVIYRVYYAARSTTLLSVEPIREIQTMGIGKPDPALMHALTFNEGDLEVNRAGQFSERQQKRLTNIYRQRKNSLQFTIVLIIVAALLLWGFIQAALNVLGQVVFSLATTIFTCYLGYRWMRLRRIFTNDLTELKINVAKGRIQLNTYEDDNGIWYKLNVNGIVWDVEQLIYASFKHSAPYAIYYAPGSKTILSAEPLPEV